MPYILTAVLLFVHVIETAYPSPSIVVAVSCNQQTRQVELFTHCFCVQNLVQRLLKDDVRLAAVHLVDAYHCG